MTMEKEQRISTKGTASQPSEKGIQSEPSHLESVDRDARINHTERYEDENLGMTFEKIGDITRRNETPNLTELREFIGYVHGQDNDQTCDRIVANRMAENLLGRSEKLTKNDAMKVLEKWKFAKNTRRKNVLMDGQEYGYSDTFGVIVPRIRNGIHDVRISKATEEYPEMTELIV